MIIEEEFGKIEFIKIENKKIENNLKYILNKIKYKDYEINLVYFYGYIKRIKIFKVPINFYYIKTYIHENIYAFKLFISPLDHYICYGYSGEFIEEFIF